MKFDFEPFVVVRLQSIRGIFQLSVEAAFDSFSTCELGLGPLVVVLLCFWLIPCSFLLVLGCVLQFYIDHLNVKFSLLVKYIVL